jgi:hypothetical protein
LPVAGAIGIAVGSRGLSADTVLAVPIFRGRYSAEERLLAPDLHGTSDADRQRALKTPTYLKLVRALLKRRQILHAHSLIRCGLFKDDWLGPLVSVASIACQCGTSG